MPTNQRVTVRHTTSTYSPATRRADATVAQSANIHPRQKSKASSDSPQTEPSARSPLQPSVDQTSRKRYNGSLDNCFAEENIGDIHGNNGRSVAHVFWAMVHWWLDV
ncbi:uncharacterized protein K452DRAFT_316908 [Aplosporella prunicola CBS 121167]|uniref:Uncharacterized protein n=1 Tax=Aplosporella prunicola CBS 121167 TaxID=1176127 RepID=A0A6A6BJ45_9PEZI|nr:uncharacterized protein K452DRAFT_316908 [Aplosporella prunicola CBS 121167]KAF2144180.1 hypothetical protein K452DRAFT_316908 [Aplosporella prunicola CBS 121167]